MNGNDIQRAREAAGVNQTDLTIALGFCGRGTLTDIESEKVEITPGYALRVIGIIEGIAASRRNAAVA